MINIQFSSDLPKSFEARVVPVFSDAIETAHLPTDQKDAIIKAAKANRFDGKAGTMFETYGSKGDIRYILAGTGKGSPEDWEKLGAGVAAKLQSSGDKIAIIDLTGLAFAPNAHAAARIGTGAALRSWRFDKHRTKLPEAQKSTLTDVFIIGADGSAAAEWKNQKAIIDGISLTRELVTEPANIIYPESFVERCERMKSLGVEFEVLGQTEMEAAGMGALLGVNQGSIREPRLLVMRWDGTKGAQKKPIVFVGKGVTFDTGGISIKPASGMEDMKWDMGGAGAVAGAMMALAGRKANAHVVGVCGLVENMPDGKAQRPGDVVTSMSGQTIEVINTDAEGRLVLCDAMTWVQRKYKPEVMIDLATLTGAMIVALGHEHGGLFSNDDGLADQLLASGKVSGEPLWRMPLGIAYDKLIDSAIADISNMGPPGKAGSITAAQFLQRFVDDGVKWAHLDIAGMAWAAKPGAVWDKGATGYGVRLLNQLVADHFEN